MHTTPMLRVSLQKSHLICLFKKFFTVDLNQQVTDEDIRFQFDQLFPSIWGRFSTEEDLDTLMDDFIALQKMPQFVDEFYEQCLAKFHTFLPNFFETIIDKVQRYNLPTCGQLENDENM